MSTCNSISQRFNGTEPSPAGGPYTQATFDIVIQTVDSSGNRLYYNPSTSNWGVTYFSFTAINVPVGAPVVTVYQEGSQYVYQFNSTNIVDPPDPYISEYFIRLVDNSGGSTDGEILDLFCIGCDCDDNCDPFMQLLSTGDQGVPNPSPDATGLNDYYTSASGTTLGDCLRQLCRPYITVPGGSGPTDSAYDAIAALHTLFHNSNTVFETACPVGTSGNFVTAMNNLTTTICDISQIIEDTLGDTWTTYVPGSGNGVPGTDFSATIQWLVDEMENLTTTDPLFNDEATYATDTTGWAIWQTYNCVTQVLCSNAGSGPFSLGAVNMNMTEAINYLLANVGVTTGPTDACTCAEIQAQINAAVATLIAHGDTNWATGVCGEGGEGVTITQINELLEDLKDFICAKLREASIQPCEAPAPGGIGNGTRLAPFCIHDCTGKPLAGASVWVTAQGTTSPLIAGTLVTDANGCVNFQLDPGTTYWFWMQHPTEVLRPNPIERLWQ